METGQAVAAGDGTQSGDQADNEAESGSLPRGGGWRCRWGTRGGRGTGLGGSFEAAGPRGHHGPLHRDAFAASDAFPATRRLRIAWVFKNLF